MATKRKNQVEENDEEENEAGESDDEGDPTEDVEEGTNTSPDGQTATRDVIEEPGEFEDQTSPARPVVTRATDGDDEEAAKPPKVSLQLAKALGLKGSDLLSYNERTRTAVFSNGGKYQISKNGKGLRHLAGPAPRADLKLNVVDARMRSSLTGAAALLNSQANDTARQD